MRWIHSIGVFFLGIGIFIAQPFHKKARAWRQGRKDYWEHLPKIPSRPVIWFHCASLGEFDQGIPLMKQLKKHDPNSFLVVTFFSPSGMEHYHKRDHPADWVGYLPLPTRKNAKKWMRYFHPEKVFFVKYEFWMNFLFEAKNNQAECYCISASFRSNQLFFGPFKSFFKPVLFLFDTIFVQNESSLQLLSSIGYKNGKLAGDTRIDKVLENRENNYPDEVVLQFLKNEKAIILGSSWPVGEKLWKNFILRHPNQKFILAPHDVSENHIQFLISSFPSAIRYTQFKVDNCENILIVDCIGKLSNLYQYAKIAYIGGGFTGKLHNILEASVFGIPVLIGPKHNKFPEATALIEMGVASIIRTEEDIERRLEALDFSRIEKNAAIYFKQNKNVAEKIKNEIFGNPSQTNE